MPRKKKANGEARAWAGDAKARDEKIREGLKRIANIEREIASITAEEIKPLREDMSAIKKELKQSWGVNLKAFAARLHAYRLECEANRRQDQELMDAVREVYDIAVVGEQFDLFKAAGSTKDKGPAEREAAKAS